MKRLATTIVVATMSACIYGQKENINYIAERLPDSWSEDKLFEQQAIGLTNQHCLREELLGRCRNGEYTQGKSCMASAAE